MYHVRLLLAVLSLVAGVAGCSRHQPVPPHVPGNATRDASWADLPTDPSVPKFVVQQGHTANIWDAVVDPIAPIAFTAGQDHSIVVWNTATCKELRTLSEIDDVTGLALSPDSKTLVSFSRGRPRLWNLETSEVRADGTNDSTVRHGAFAPDGTTIVAIGSPKPIVFDAKTARALRQVDVGLYPRVMAMHPRRALAAFGGEGGTVVLASMIEGGSPITRLATTSKSDVTAITFAADGRLLVVGSQDGRVEVFDVANGQPNRVLAGPNAAVHALTSPGISSQVVGGDWRGQLFLWDADTGETIRSVKLPTHGVLPGVQQLAAPSNGDYALWVSTEGVGTWRPGDKGEPIPFQTTHSRFIAAFAPRRDEIAIAQDSILTFMAASTGRIVHQHNLGEALVQTLTYSADGKKLAVTLVNSASLVVDTTTRAVKVLPPVAASVVMATALSADGTIFAEGDFAGALRLRSTLDGHEVAHIEQGAPVNCIRFRNDESLVLSSGLALAQASLRLSRVQDGSLVREYSSLSLTDATSSPLLPGSAPLALSDSYSACAFGPGGSTVLAGTSLGPVRVFSTESGQLIRSFEGHSSAITGIEPLSSAEILTASDDGTARLWDATTGKCRRTYVGHTAGIYGLMPGSDATFLTGSLDGTIKYWKADRELSLYSLAPIPLRDDLDMTTGTSWVAWNARGFFDVADARASAWVHLVRNRDAIELRQLIDVFYRPGLIENVNRGGLLSKQVDLTTAFHLPPRVSVQARLDAGRIVVGIHTDVQDGGLSDVKLYSNGRLVGGRPVTAGPGEKADTALSFSPMAGRNSVVAVAYSRDHIKSFSSNVDVENTASNSTPRVMYVLAVGIGDYGDRLPPLKGAKDATDFALKYAHATPVDFTQFVPTVLPDDKATKHAILAAIQRIAARADDNDAFVLFLAGHGMAHVEAEGRVFVNRYYFAPVDYEPRRPAPEGLLSGDLILDALSRVRAGDVTIILDTCHSGATSDTLDHDSLGTLRALGTDAGINVLASATAAQTSTEVGSIGRGAFTSSLLDLLSCKKPGRIHFSELSTDIDQRVSSILHTQELQTVHASNSQRDPVLIECP